MEVLTVTKSEVIKEFFKKSVLPVAVAALLYCIFKSACTKDGVTDYVWLFILCGLPFGIPCTVDGIITTRTNVMERKLKDISLNEDETPTLDGEE